MNWTLDPTKVDSLNDSAFRNLLVGTHEYLITGAEVFTGKDNKPPQIKFSLENDGVSYSVFLGVMSDNLTQREIANKTVKAFMDAVGFSGLMKVERLLSFKGKRVVITATEKEGTDSNGKPVTRVNIQTVEKAFTDSPAPAPQAEYIAPAPEPAEAPPSDAAPVSAPASTPPGGVPPWKRAQA